MKILWLSMNDGLLGQNDTSGYGGMGWIASLQSLVESTDNELALAYVADEGSCQPCRTGRTSYFPIFRKRKCALAKLMEYYGIHKKDESERYCLQVKDVISQFEPDVVHLFGIENPLAVVLGKINLPIIVHLQGILGPVCNAYFPPSFSLSSFLFPPTVREWLLRNGSIFAYRDMVARSERELEMLKSSKYFMGRTRWDKGVAELLSPGSKYFHVSEVLRPVFYDKSGMWHSSTGSFQILSTLSPVAYKGLDMVLKTASLLKKLRGNIFVWKIVGVDASSNVVRIFERTTGIKSADANVEYLGVRSAEELSQDLFESKVYVHPSYIDNSSNSICEAQMVGIPVIATNVGGTASLIEDGATGYLVPSNGVFELAGRLAQIIENPGEANEIGRRAADMAAKRHDRTAVLNHLMHAYSEAAQFNR